MPQAPQATQGLFEFGLKASEVAQEIDHLLLLPDGQGHIVVDRGDPRVSDCILFRPIAILAVPQLQGDIPNGPKQHVVRAGMVARRFRRFLRSPPCAVTANGEKGVVEEPPPQEVDGPVVIKLDRVYGGVYDLAIPQIHPQATHFFFRDCGCPIASPPAWGAWPPMAGMETLQVCVHLGFEGGLFGRFLDLQESRFLLGARGIFFQLSPTSRHWEVLGGWVVFGPFKL